MGHHTKKFTEKGRDLFVNYVLRLILYEAPAKALLLIIEILSICSSTNLFSDSERLQQHHAFDILRSLVLL